MLKMGFRYLRHRYLFCCVSLFIIGISVSVFGGTSLPLVFAAFILGAVFVLIAAAVLLRSLKRPSAAAAALLLVYLASLVIGFAYPGVYIKLRYGGADGLDGTTAEINGRIVTNPRPSSTGKTFSAIVKTDKIKCGGRDIYKSIRIYASLPSGCELKRGDGIKMTAKISLPEKYLDSFPYRRYLLANDCYYTAQVKETSKYEPNLSPFDRIMTAAFAAGDKISEYCGKAFYDKDAGALLRGILIGSRDAFSDELYEIMSTSGFMHIAAVSGLHIGFLSGVIFLILRYLRRGFRIFAAAPVLLFYMAAASFTPSVCRAVIMTNLVMLSWLILRTPDPVTSLAASALLFCIINPYITASVSFMMSYAATLALLLFMPPLTIISAHYCRRLTERLKRSRLFRRKRVSGAAYAAMLSIALSACVSTACQIGITPIAVHYFNNIAPLSFIGNIIVVPCTMIVFVTGLACTAVYALFPAPALILSRVFVYPFLKIIMSCADLFSNFSYSPNFRPGLIGAALFYFLALILLYFLTKFSKKFDKSLKHPEKT